MNATPLNKWESRAEMMQFFFVILIFATIFLLPLVYNGNIKRISHLQMRDNNESTSLKWSELVKIIRRIIT